MNELRSTRRHGFTLVEIVTVVVILGIVAALAVPNLAQRQDVDVSAASRIVLSDLLYAQSQAIATQQYQYVSFTIASTLPGGTSGYYDLSSPYGSLLYDPITQQPYSRICGDSMVSPLSNVALTGVTLDNPANTVLAFNELGQPMACPPNGSPVPIVSTGTIDLQCGSITVTLSIEPATGNITVSSPQKQ